MVMRAIGAVVVKECLSLLRDRTGLALLFVLPAVLVVVITLVQERVTATSAELLLVDHDKGRVSTELRRLLADSDLILAEAESSSQSDAEVRSLVAGGDYQFALILPAGLSAAMESRVTRQLHNHLTAGNKQALPAVPQVTILFDPTVQGGFRAAVRSGVSRVLAAIESQCLVEEAVRLLVPQLRTAAGSGNAVEPQTLLPQLYGEGRLLEISEEFASDMGFVSQPTAVQQNVPAWTIFGIFFIAVPLASAIIGERNAGIRQRLAILPISQTALVTGRLLAYILVCLVQSMVILAAGWYLLPVLGVAAFTAGFFPGQLFLVLLATVAAACGYGLLLGSLGKTGEQIAVVAPVSIVLAAAVGGIMVPVYALPELLRPLSTISPLYWSQSACYDLLLRLQGGWAIVPELAALLFFAAACSLTASWLGDRRQ